MTATMPAAAPAGTSISPLAGKPAPRDMLVDVGRLPCSSWARRRSSPTPPAARLLPGHRGPRGPGHRQRALAGRVPGRNQLVGAADRRVPVRLRAWRCRSPRMPPLRAGRAADLARRRPVPGRTRRARQPSFRADMAEGIRWLPAHPPMRTLALTIFAFNVTFGAAWSVLVLYASERLGMGALGFGLLTTAIAIGGIIGTVSYGRLERRFCLGRHHAGGPAHRDLHPPVARADHVAGGRTRDVGGLRRTCVRLGHDLDRGPPARGPGRAPRPGDRRLSRRDHRRAGDRHADRWPLRRAFGITAPFWFGFFGSALLVVLLWRQFDHIVHAGEVTEPALS